MSWPWPAEPAAQDLPAAEEVARALADVLARAEFAPREPGLIARAWHALSDIVGGLLRRLFGGFDLTPGTGRVLVLTVGLLLAAVAVLILVRLGRIVVLRAARRWRDRARRTSVSSAKRVTSDRETTEAWAARARAAAAAARWRDAALALYRALVLRLDARGVVRYHRAKTPGDYRREAAGDATAGRTLEGFLRAFEPIAYGRAVAVDADYSRLRTAARELGVRG